MNLYDTNVNILRPLSVYDVVLPRQDPGPDGVLATPDDGGTVILYDYNPAYRGAAFVATPPVNRSSGRDDRFSTIEMTAQKRRSANFDFVASVSATKNHRWLVGVPQRPTDDYFALDTTWSWQAKLTGSVFVPYGIQVSTYWQALSGAPGQRTYVFRNLPQSGTLTVRMEPYGEQRLPTLQNVNLRVNKRLNLGKYRLELGVDVSQSVQREHGDGDHIRLRSELRRDHVDLPAAHRRRRGDVLVLNAMSDRHAHPSIALAVLLGCTAGAGPSRRTLRRRGRFTCSKPRSTTSTPVSRPGSSRAGNWWLCISNGSRPSTMSARA